MAEIRSHGGMSRKKTARPQPVWVKLSSYARALATDLRLRVLLFIPIHLSQLLSGQPKLGQIAKTVYIRLFT